MVFFNSTYSLRWSCNVPFKASMRQSRFGDNSEVGNSGCEYFSVNNAPQIEAPLFEQFYMHQGSVLGSLAHIMEVGLR